MEALVERLSQLDTQAEGAIRVVVFYDTLIQRRVDLPALARASAGLAECVAGIRLHGTGRTIRVAPDGRQAPAPARPWRPPHRMPPRSARSSPGLRWSWARATWTPLAHAIIIVRRLIRRAWTCYRWQDRPSRRP